MSLSKKIAEQYLAQQPLQLQPDYGSEASRIADLYASKEGATFLAEEHEADFDKQSKVKSLKHHSQEEVCESLAEHLKKSPKMLENYGKYDPSRNEMLPNVNWEKNKCTKQVRKLLDKGLTALDRLASYDDIIDDIGLGRVASQIPMDTVLDSKGKEVHLHDTIRHMGSEAVVTELFYDIGRRAHYVGHQHSNGKRMTAPASEITLISSSRRASLTAGNEESGSYMSRQNLREMDDQVDFILDHMEDSNEMELDDWVEDKISHGHSALSDVARHLGYGDDHLHGDYEDDEIIDDIGLGRMASMSKRSAGGMYGFTKAVQNDVEVAIRKLEKKVDQLSSRVEGAHPEAGSFFQDRACPASTALANQCLVFKRPSRVLAGPMGYKPSTAKASLKAISDLTLFAGQVANSLYGKNRNHIPFLEQHAQETGCPLARLLLENHPQEV